MNRLIYFVCLYCMTLFLAAPASQALVPQTARYVSANGGCSFTVIRDDFRSGAIYNMTLIIEEKPLIAMQFSLNEVNFTDLFITGSAYRQYKTDLYSDATMRTLSVGRIAPNGEIKRRFEILQTEMDIHSTESNYAVFNLTDDLLLESVEVRLRRFEHPGEQTTKISKARLISRQCSGFKPVK